MLIPFRLESGNSIEEKLLKNGTKDLIREVAAQGTDYTLAFLTQVHTHTHTFRTLYTRPVHLLVQLLNLTCFCNGLSFCFIVSNDVPNLFFVQRTIQDLFEVEAGSGEKVEEFVVLHQEPSPSESIPPHMARPYIQALNTITLQTLHPEEGLKKKELEKLEGQVEEEEEERELTGEASQLEELVSVVEQVIRGRLLLKWCDGL